jgi:hypothetical protein
MMEWIPVRFYGLSRDVIHGWPLEVKKELGSVLTRLQKGESIGMPDVRPMPDISQQVSSGRNLASCSFMRFRRRAAKLPKGRRRPRELDLKPF